MVKKVKVTVIKQTGHCRNHCVPGDLAFIHEHGVDGRICIHALYSLLPKAFAMLHNATFPWVPDGNNPTHACPDARNPVVFKLEVIGMEEEK